MTATPTLEKVLKDAVRAGLLDTHTSFPGEVVSYDAGTQKAAIQPLMKLRYVSDDSIASLPQIKNVPVVTYSGSEDTFFFVPISVGCLGMVNICERSIDAWLAGDGRGFEPGDPRHHDISDAWFTPGVRPFKKALPVPDSESILIKNKQLTVTIDPSGKISIKGASEELLGLFDEFITTVSTGGIAVSGATGVFNPATISAFTALKVRLSTLLKV